METLRIWWSCCCVYQLKQCSICVYSIENKSLTKKVVGKLLMDFDMSVLYHPIMANVIADALSCVTMGSVSHIEEFKKDILKFFHRLA